MEKTNDPVRMYLREMGTVPLLTREGEVEIAKRIERGQNRVMKAISRSPIVIREIVALGEDLRRGVRNIKEVVTFDEEELTEEILQARVRATAGRIDVIVKHQKKLVGLQEKLAAPNFRLYTNDDVLGVELAAAMKNVIAVAAGTCQGLNLGANTLAALITRGLAEMGRLAAAVGARPETLSGLAGLGDLVLTCNGSLSRNRHVGIELAKGRPLGEILAGMSGVAEGVDTAKPLLALAKEHKVELPITIQVEAILRGDQNPRAAIREIMERPQKRE